MRRQTIFLILFLSLIPTIALSLIGYRISELSTRAIDEWFPKREYACFEHSGEFNTLFSLRFLGEIILAMGGFSTLFLCIGISEFYVRERVKK